MSRITVILKLAERVLKSTAWLPPLLARLTIGWVFVESGWGKLHHLDKVTAFFAELGLPMPGFQAHLVASTEFLGGLLLLGGLFTRLASAPLMIIMAVAIITAKREDLHGFSDLIGFPEYLYMLLLFWLAVAGAGAVSLDRLIQRKISRSKYQAPAP